MTTLNYFEEVLDFEQFFDELYLNSDFIYIGHFDLIQDIYEEFNDHGFTDEEIDELCKARHGDVVEILEFNSSYDVFVGVY